MALLTAAEFKQHHITTLPDEAVQRFIDSAETAFAKIEAGATLLQVYSALVFEGIGLVGRIKRGIVGRLAQEGLDSLAPVVGRSARSLTA